MQNDSKKKVNTIIRWVGSILSLAIMVWLLSKVGWAEAWETIRRLAWWRITLVLVLVFVSRMATYFRWQTLLSAQDATISKKDVLKLTFAGLFASNFLPTTIGGDVFRLAGAIRAGMDSALAAASLIADRIVGMSGMTLALPLSIPAFISFLKQPKVLESGLETLTPLVAGALPGHTLEESDGEAHAEPQIVRKKVPMFKRLAEKLRKGIKKVFDSLRFWLKRPQSLMKALGFTLVHQLAIYLIITLLIEGMGESLAFHHVAGIWSITYFITLLPISVNGLGLAEVTITSLYTELGGISPATSIGLAVILRVVWMVGSLPGALFIGDALAGKEKTDSLEDMTNGPETK